MYQLILMFFSLEKGNDNRTRIDNIFKLYAALFLLLVSLPPIV